MSCVLAGCAGRIVVVAAVQHGKVVSGGRADAVYSTSAMHQHSGCITRLEKHQQCMRT